MWSGGRMVQASAGLVVYAVCSITALGFGWQNRWISRLLWKSPTKEFLWNTNISAADEGSSKLPKRLYFKEILWLVISTREPWVMQPSWTSFFNKNRWNYAWNHLYMYCQLINGKFSVASIKETEWSHVAWVLWLCTYFGDHHSWCVAVTYRVRIAPGLFGSMLSMQTSIKHDVASLHMGSI